MGITGEVAEFYAAKFLGLWLLPAREPGYDAILQKGDKKLRVQIKGRCIPKKAKPGQRIGSIKLDKEWDCVVLVLMDEDLEATKIYEADRTAVEEALRFPGSKARNERGALSVNKLKSIGRLMWSGNIA